MANSYQETESKVTAARNSTQKASFSVVGRGRGSSTSTKTKFGTATEPIPA
jgi:hypothetical protein